MPGARALPRRLAGSAVVRTRCRRHRSLAAAWLCSSPPACLTRTRCAWLRCFCAVFDGYAGWETGARFKIRVVCARPYHALFMHNMLIR